MTWHGFSWPGSILWMPLRPSGLWSPDAVILTERSLFDVVADRSEVGPHCFYFMIYRYLLFVPIFDLSLRAVYRWTACLETLGCYDMLIGLIWLILSSFPLVSMGGMYILTVVPPWQLTWHSLHLRRLLFMYCLYRFLRVTCQLLHLYAFCCIKVPSLP